MTHRTTLLVAFALTSAFFFVSIDAVNANPNTAKPETPLAAHGTIPGAKDLVSSLYDIYYQHEKTAIDLIGRASRPERLPYRQMAKAGGDLWKAQRDAEHLALMGEPASKDLASRMNMVRGEFNKLMGQYRGTAPGGKQFQKNMQLVKRKKVSTDKKLAQLAQRIKSAGGLEQAEKELESIGRELQELIFIFTTNEKVPFVKEFTRVMGELDSKLDSVRRQKYLDQAKQVVSKNMQKVNGFAAEAKRIRNELATGKVKLGDNDEGNAPQAIQYLAKEWSKASATLIRNTAIQWAFTRTAPSKINASQMPTVSQVAQTAKTAIIGVIDAAAIAAQPDEIPQLYSEILKELSYIDRRMTGSGISKDCEPALAKLAAKSPGLPEQIAGYARATEQPLIWRQRFARASAKQHIAYPTASALFGQKLVPKATVKPAMYGPFRANQRVLLTKDVGVGASWKVAEAGSVVLGKRVSESNMVRLFPNSRTALVPHQSIHFSNIAVGISIKRELGDLQNSLMISETHAPLTINTADAISSAELRDYEKVGGDISRLHLESALARFIALPDVVQSLAPLGTLPTILDEMPAIDQACWRLDITPHWIQHKYFTVAIQDKLPK